MYELIPILTGVVAGSVAWRLTAWRGRVLVIAVLGLTAALVAGTASGELAESWLFLPWDLAQSIAAATLTMLALPHLLGRTRSR
jgi:hypothetical protein